MINIKIQKKDLWLLAAIMVFLVGVAYVIAYNSGASPSVMGHSADEIEGVCLSNGTNCPSLGGGFGVWNDRNKDGVADSVNFDTNYYAETDGFVTAWVEYSAWPYMHAYTDNKTNPTTLIMREGPDDEGGSWQSLTLPVRKGDYWRIELTGSTPTKGIRWLPLGN